MYRAPVIASLLAALAASSSLAGLPLDEPAYGLQCGHDLQLFSMDAQGHVRTLAVPTHCGWTFAVSMGGHPLTATNSGPFMGQSPTLWRIDIGSGALIEMVRDLPGNIQCIAVNPVPVPAPDGAEFPADSIFIVAQPSFNPHLLVIRPGEDSYVDIGPAGNGYNWWHDAECAFSPEGRLFLVTEVTSNRRLRQVDTATGAFLPDRPLELDKVEYLDSIAFTADGDLIGTGVQEGYAWTFAINPKNGRMAPRRPLHGPEGAPAIHRSAIAFRPAAPPSP